MTLHVCCPFHSYDTHINLLLYIAIAWSSTVHVFLFHIHHRVSLNLIFSSFNTFPSHQSYKPMLHCTYMDSDLIVLCVLSIAIFIPSYSFLFISNSLPFIILNRILWICTYMCKNLWLYVTLCWQVSRMLCLTWVSVWTVAEWTTPPSNKTRLSCSHLMLSLQLVQGTACQAILSIFYYLKQCFIYMDIPLKYFICEKLFPWC